MKKIIASIAAIPLLSIAAIVPAHAEDGVLEMAKAKQCLSCHSVDKDMIGPSFKNVARKFKGLNNGQALIEETIMKGSGNSGAVHWGTNRMPPSGGARPEVMRYEAMIFAQWILNMK